MSFAKSNDLKIAEVKFVKSIKMSNFALCQHIVSSGMTADMTY